MMRMTINYDIDAIKREDSLLYRYKNKNRRFYPC